MWKDPIVEEIRAVRQSWAESCDFDMQKMYDSIAQRQELAKAQGRKFASFSPRQPIEWPAIVVSKVLPQGALGI